MPHLAGEMLQLQAGIKLQEVPYSGGAAQAFGDVVSGRVEMIVEGYSALAGAVQSGSVTLIGVALEKRLPDFPDVPTVAETIPGFRATGWAAMLAPLGTPQSIIDKINAGLNTVISQPELRKKLEAIGSGVNPMSATETNTFVNNQQQTWQPVVCRPKSGSVLRISTGYYPDSRPTGKE
jgi:tripartite-type tricarboxylate transporter receptor subunit TctC